MKRFLSLILILAALFPMIFIHSCANTTQAPTGGPKDTIPPLIIGINPLPGTFNVPVHNTQIVFTFNEYVTVKDDRAIVVSPPLEKKVKTRISGKSLILKFDEDLLPGRTYTVDLGGAIVDNNENNPFPGYTYVFSTGERIDSMMMTGTVRNCEDLKAVKDAKVLIYKDHSDSAIFLRRPDACAKTDDWGYFTLPFIQDTLYRVYALKDANDNCIYDADGIEKVAFIDSLVKPVMKVVDTIPEMLRYEMTDTVHCQARKSEHELLLFREKPSKQVIRDRVRLSDRAFYVSFMAPDAYIDTLWVAGYKSRRIITQFNIEQDSLEVWINDRKNAPDTLHVFLKYRKTDTLGHLKPTLEHLRLPMPEGKRVLSRIPKRKLKHEDTTCVFKINAEPQTIEQNGYEFVFDYPLIFEKFDSLDFHFINPRQKEFKAKFTVKRDTLDLKKYILRPREKFQAGNDYILKVPPRMFRDINGFWSDSTEVKLQLPSDDKLSTLNLSVKGVSHKVIIELMDEAMSKVVRSYIIDSDRTLPFPYLAEGKYAIRITDDGNRNSLVDTGNLLEHRQPEMVVYYETPDGGKLLNIPPSSTIDQTINLNKLLK